MSRDPAHPDLEVVASIELPLALDLAIAVSNSIEATLTRRGYTDVVILTDRGYCIAAKPPPPGWEPPDDLDDDDDEDDADGRRCIHCGQFAADHLAFGKCPVEVNGWRHTFEEGEAP